MIISKEFKSFLKKANVLISNNRNQSVQGVLIDRKSGQAVASTGYVQLVFNIEDILTDEVFVLPITAIKFLLSFDEGKSVNLDYSNEQKSVTVKCGKSHSKFPLLDTTAYPIMDATVSNWNSIDDDIIKFIVQTSINADVRSAIIAARGINIVKDNDKMYCYSCDGTCLTSAEIPVDSKFEGVNIPQSIVPYISEFSESSNIEMGISDNARKIVIKDNNMALTASLIDGFASNLIPQLNVALKDTNVCTVNKREFLAVLQRVAVVSQTKRIILTFSPDEIIIKSHDEVVEFEDSVSVTNSKVNEAKSVGLYVNQLIKQLGCYGDVLKIYSKDKLNPIVFQGNGISSLIMPIRI